MDNSTTDESEIESIEDSIINSTSDIDDSVINSTNNEDYASDEEIGETDNENNLSKAQNDSIQSERSGDNSINSRNAEQSIQSEKSNSSKNPINNSNSMNDSTDSKSCQEQQNSSDDEDDVIILNKKKTKTNRIADDSDDENGKSSDDEEKERKSFYQQNPEGDLSNIVEDNVYSKATRRSIFGFEPPKIKCEPGSDIDETSDEDDDVILLSDSSDGAAFDDSGLIEKKMSSTIRSPFKEIDTNIIIKSEKESPKEESFKKVSKSFYDAQLAEKEALHSRLITLKNLVMRGVVPDGGKKLKIAIAKVEDEIVEKENVIKQLVVDKDESVKSQLVESFKKGKSLERDSDQSSSNNDFMATEDVQPKYTGKVGMKHFEQQKALTVEKLQDIHQSLNQRPADDVLAEPPKYLKVELMKHQLHALAFMMWRETQKPRGGILADDMGLGKTLTVISLILKQLQISDEAEEDEESEDDEAEREIEDEWVARGHKALRPGGTLVVCPASLINQWEQEIKTKAKRNVLEVNVFHGAKRIYKAKQLARFDVVITTYQIILSEFKNNGCLFGVKWDRIVLDEGHVIRNYRSKQSEAVCSLFSKKRWVLTGTPIQNKEFDLYATIKFLKCTPFDDLRYWRMWIETRNKNSSPRLQALLKSILLRRTKTQLQENGEIKQLPNKEFEKYCVALNQEERLVYNRMMALSQQVFAQFLAQQQEKHNTYSYDRNQLQKLHQRFAKINNVGREVKSHEILTLLLRLRQICCHPGLVKEAIENNELMNNDFDGDFNNSADENDIDILKRLQNLKIGSNEDNHPTINAITSESDAFNMDIPSSKVEKLMEVLKEKLLNSDDKAIIVSQWVSYLNIIKGMLEIEGIGYCELNGSIQVKFRNDIVVDFNNPRSKKKVMLLSITAGGVGLNLVGANHLFIMDPHWNPQIEQQAQDRIYRFGQEKNVKIFKFICEDTIEEKILLKQQEKMDLATSTLTGAKRSATKLTIEDLKDLFGMK